MVRMAMVVMVYSLNTTIMMMMVIRYIVYYSTYTNSVRACEPLKAWRFNVSMLFS